MEIFDKLMPGPNQLGKLRQDVNVAQKDLLEVHQGTRTEAGLRENIRVGVQYIEAWLRGSGAVPLYHMMEDAATAEISRTQLWQWIRHAASLDDGRTVTRELVARIVDEELVRIGAEIGVERLRTGRFADAVKLFLALVEARELAEFLTLAAYPLLEDLTPRVVIPR